MTKYFLFMVFLLALGGALFSLSACDSDDDDDNDQAGPADDDNDDDNDDAADDDDNDDDDNDDNDDDDDNDNDNDNDNNDDTPDYAKEPIAVLSGSTHFAAVGDSVSFTGEDSTDPNGSLLTYEYDFGDGQSATGMTAQHAFGAGTFPVVLTVTNEEGYADKSSWLVTAGDLPTGIGALDEIGFAPNYYNPEVIEQGSKPDHGGLLYGFFIVPFDCAPDTILINGLPGNSTDGDVEWCEVIGNELLAGDIAILRCHSYSAAFDAGDPVTIQIKQGETEIWSYSGTLPAPSLTPSYITANVAADEILVHVRNDAEDSLTVTGLSIDGLDVSNYVSIDNPQIAPGELALIRVPQPAGVEFGPWRVFSVHGTDGRAALTVSRSLRLFPPIFPVGDWNGDDAFTDEAALQTYLSVGINMFIYYPSDTNPPETVFALAEENDFYLFTHQGEPDAYFQNFILDWGDHPRLLTNAVSGEGDLSGPAGEALPRVRNNRDLWGDAKPLWIYDACSYQFPAWGTLPDISGMDHYCVWAPKCNYNWPLFYWDRIEFTGYYAFAMKTTAEPRPSWNWTQAMFNTLDINGVQLRCTSADEIRAQFFQNLAYGVKGLLWFNHNPEWDEKCPEEPEQEMAKLVAELRQIDSLLLESDISPAGFIAAVNDETVDLTAAVSPRGIVVLLTNLDYQLNLLTPWEWHEKTDLTIDLYPPNGFEPLNFELLDGGDRSPLTWVKLAPDHWQAVLPALRVGAAILVTPEP
ncbi:MAG: PKD domain-containing protein [Myxococcales bacterium]|nr:PKD domain-containing protein [Myxococcales bacterium]